MPKFVAIQIKEKLSDQFSFLTSILTLNIKKVCHLYVAIQFVAVIMVIMSFLLKKTLL